MRLQRPAPAKLNLGLHVLRKRADGYHDLETVFLRIPWADHVSAEPADDLSMTCSDPDLPTDASNLCMKAARRLAEVTGTTQGARLHLDKHVPYGAGLGGGSSDAAATLRLLAELWALDDAEETLHEVAAELGSDVPFFLGPAAAIGTGRGEALQPLTGVDGAPYRLPFPLVVVVPPVHVSTAEAYGLVRPHAEGRPDLAAVVRSNELSRWRRELVNDFERPVQARYPVVAAVRQLLEEAGAGYVALSGSGSALFGVFEDDGGATAAAEVARQQGYRVWSGRASAAR